MKRSALIFAAFVAASPLAVAAEGGHGDGNAFWAGFSHFLDPVTNVAALAVASFLILVWRLGGFKTVTSMLDARAEAIEKELNEARDLREKAAKALAEAERRQKVADEEASAIIAQAKKDAKAMLEQSHAELEARLKRRESQAESRIARAESEAADDVRRTAADAATRAARAVLTAQVGAGQIDAALGEIEKALD